jgi:hypothetical protein
MVLLLGKLLGFANNFVTLHSKEMSMYVFPEKEVRCLSSNFHVHVSVSDQFSYFPAAE